MEYVQNTLHLKAGNKTVLIYIYETHPLDFLFSIILHDKMDFSPHNCLPGYYETWRLCKATFVT